MCSALLVVDLSGKYSVEQFPQWTVAVIQGHRLHAAGHRYGVTEGAARDDAGFLQEFINGAIDCPNADLAFQ